METKKISVKAFEEAKAKKPVKGKYTAVIAEVIASGEPVELSGLTRGQVSALYRAVQGKAVEGVFSYAEGKAYIAKKVEK